MKELVRWGQGWGAEVHGYRHFPKVDPGDTATMCLALATLQGANFDLTELGRLDAIVCALFPERVCSCVSVFERVTHFNDHPDTTRDHIDKILHTYHLEYDE